MTTHAWQHANAPLRGSAILLALFFLTALFLLAQAFQRLLPVELNAALIHQTDTSAYFAADAGVQDAIAYIENELANGREPLTAASSTRSGAIGTWTWTSILTADSQSPPNGQNPVRYYTVASTAHLNGRPMRRITTSVGQQSFARFALYSDKSDPNAAFNTSSLGLAKEGPVHINDPIKIWTYPNQYDGSYKPHFLSTVTSATRVAGSADGVAYWNGNGGGSGSTGYPPYDSNGNPVPGHYETIYAQGRVALNTGVSRIELPPTTSALANAAWGDPTMPAPTTAGVYVNQAKTGNDAAGGIYIVGGVSKMEMSVDGGGNRVLTITQASGKTVVTETLSSAVTAPGGQNVPQGRTLVVPPSGKSQVLNTLTNGVVFSTGTIASLSGTSKGARTISTDVDAQAEIVVGGSITRSDTTPGQAPTGSTDNLGLVSYNLRFPSSLPRSTNPANKLYVYAAILAGVPGGNGGAVYENISGPVGLLDIYGSLSVASKSPKAQSNGVQVTGGWSGKTYYDPNLASTPPPFYPTLNSFSLKSWKDEASPR